MHKTNRSTDTLIYFGVTQGVSFYSKIIKWFQWGNPNVHVFYLPEEGYKEIDPVIIESMAGYGVHEDKLSKSHTPGTIYTVFSLRVTKKQKEEFEQFLRSKIGLKYDYRGLLGFGIRVNTNIKDKYFCSELVYEGLQSVGVNLFRTLKPEQVFPSLFIESILLKEEYKTNTI